MAERRPAEVFPPGDFLREELEARGWTQTHLAKLMGMRVGTVSAIVEGRRGISPMTAVRIAAALGTSAEFWLNLEAAYQRARVDSNRLLRDAPPRPVRSAEDLRQERANLVAERDALEARLAWVRAVLAGLERGDAAGA